MRTKNINGNKNKSAKLNFAFCIIVNSVIFLSPIISLSQIKRGQTPELPQAQVKVKKDKVAVKVAKPTVSDAELARLKQKLPEYDNYFWNLIKNSRNPDDFRQYLKMFPKGQYAAQAKNKIAELEKEKQQSQKLGKRRCALDALGIKPPSGTFWNEYCMTFVLIPSGSFQMGSSFGDKDETPVRDVKINSFYMAKSEVTQYQWYQVMNSFPAYFKAPESAKGSELFSILSLKYGNLPVESITWEDAQEFVNKLNQLNDGYYYRLPTEAEWEYVAHSNTAFDITKSTDVLSIYAWFGNNSGINAIDAASIWSNDKENYSTRLLANENKTHVVNTKKPNSYGIFDMQGNVWEWCEDYYQPNYNGAPVDGSEVTTPNEKGLRVLRGCSWYSDANSCRVTNRIYYPQDESGSTIGLRIVAESKLQFLLKLRQSK